MIYESFVIAVKMRGVERTGCRVAPRRRSLSSYKARSQQCAPSLYSYAPCAPFITVVTLAVFVSVVALYEVAVIMTPRTLGTTLLSRRM